MSSEASATTSTLWPGVISRLPDAVLRWSTGNVESAIGRITSAAVPTLPAASTAVACSLALWPDVAVDGTVKLNEASVDV